MRAAPLAALVAIVLGVVSPATPAAQGAPAPARLSGQGCSSAVATFAMPLGAAQSAVPAPFRAFDYGNLLATGRVQFTHCDRLSVDGGPNGRGVFSSASIDIEPPPGAPGASVHSYELWHVVTRGDVRQRYAEWGMAGGQVADLTYDALAPPPFNVARGDSAWTQSSYNLTVSTPDPTDGLPAATVESHWHRGPDGPFRTLVKMDEVFHAGTAVVQTTPGSRLSSLFLGLPGMAGAGMIRTFSFTAIIEAVSIR